MRFLVTFLIAMCMSFVAFASEKSGAGGFIEKGAVYASLVVMVVEFLIANTKLLKANSTIDLILDVLKFVFGLGKDDEK